MQEWPETAPPRRREKHPQWFKRLGDIEADGVAELMDTGFILVLPGRDAAGRRVLLNCVNRIDTEVLFAYVDLRSMQGLQRSWS